MSPVKRFALQGKDAIQMYCTVLYQFTSLFPEKLGGDIPKTLPLFTCMTTICDFPNPTKDQALVVQRLHNAIHQINHYPVDSVVCFVNTYPVDSDLSSG